MPAVPSHVQTLASRLRHKFKDLPSYQLAGKTFDVRHLDQFISREP